MTEHKQAMEKARDALHNVTGLLRAHIGPDDSLGIAIIKDARHAEDALRAALSSLPDVQAEPNDYGDGDPVVSALLNVAMYDDRGNQQKMRNRIRVILSAASAPKEPQ
jgi:hypothetical protein